MNRRKAPLTVTSAELKGMEPVVIPLKNGIPLYLISGGSQPVIRMDFIFSAGSWWQPKPLVASSAINMLTEGTRKKSGKEIAEKLDYHGAYINTSSDRDNAFITAYYLEKHKDEILPLIAEIIKEPAFPEAEFHIYREKRKQNFLIEKSKTVNMAREMFAIALYGEHHPYGQTYSTDDFENICREDLAAFHFSRFHSGNCRIIVSGKFNESVLIAAVDELFGDRWEGRGNNYNVKREKLPSSEKSIFVPRQGAVQSSLRIGHETFNRSHPHFAGLFVLNNLLGGYFGSRLMQNIREKKGYTYGIGSALVALKNSGYIVIVSEVGASHRKDAVKEIYRELDRLCEKLVPKKELELTRCQMMGEVLRDFDGPFARAESIRNLVEHDIAPDYYRNLVSTILHIGPPELRGLAAEYLAPGIMYEIVAGSE
jgi:zinc protease